MWFAFNLHVIEWHIQWLDLSCWHTRVSGKTELRQNAFRSCRSFSTVNALWLRAFCSSFTTSTNEAIFQHFFKFSVSVFSWDVPNIGNRSVRHSFQALRPPINVCWIVKWILSIKCLFIVYVIVFRFCRPFSTAITLWMLAFSSSVTLRTFVFSCFSWTSQSPFFFQAYNW